MKLPVFNYDQLVSKSEAGQKVFHQGVFKPIDLSCLIETLVVPKSKKQRMPWIKSILFRFYCILLEKPFRDDDKKSLQYIRDLPDNEAYKLMGNLIVKKKGRASQTVFTITPLIKQDAVTVHQFSVVFRLGSIERTGFEWGNHSRPYSANTKNKRTIPLFKRKRSSYAND